MEPEAERSKSLPYVMRKGVFDEFLILILVFAHIDDSVLNLTWSALNAYAHSERRRPYLLILVSQSVN